MKFETLTIENFLAIGKATVELADRGLILLQGDNRDESSAVSNGAGKSSIGDAISYVLFNKTARGLTGDAVVNRTIGKDCRVTLTLSDGNNSYEIRRYRKHTEGKNRLEVIELADQPIDLTKGTDALTQELVDEIIGCSYEVFTAAVYAGQEIFPDLPAMTDKMLKALIEEASGVERLTRAYDVARTRLNDAKREHDLSDQQVDRIGAEIQQLESQIAQQRDAESKWVQQQQASIQTQQQQLEQARAQLQQAEQIVDQALRERVQVGLGTVQERFDSIKPLQDELSRLQQVASQAQTRLTMAKAEKHKVEVAIDNLIHERAHLDHKVGQPCGECGKAYAAEDLASARAIMDQKLEAARAEQLNAKLSVQEATEGLQKASDAVSSQQATIPDVSQLNQAQSRLHQERDRFTQEDRKLEQMRSGLLNAEQQIQHLQAQINPVTQTVVYIQQSLVEKQKQQADYLTKHQSHVNNLLLAKDAADVFGPAGVRAEILDTVTPFLNERTAYYLGTLSDGNLSATWQTLTRTKKGEPKEKFSIDVTSTTGGESFKSISGGEKRKVRLATAMALSDLVASRATKPIDLFIGDEIDNAVDESGLQRLMEVLEGKARERGTVLVISHNDLAGFIRQSMTVVKQGGVGWIE